MSMLDDGGKVCRTRSAYPQYDGGRIGVYDCWCCQHFMKIFFFLFAGKGGKKEKEKKRKSVWQLCVAWVLCQKKVKNRIHVSVFPWGYEMNRHWKYFSGYNIFRSNITGFLFIFMRHNERVYLYMYDVRRYIAFLCSFYCSFIYWNKTIFFNRTFGERFLWDVGSLK